MTEEVWGFDQPIPLVAKPTPVSITSVDLTDRSEKQPQEDQEMGRPSKFTTNQLDTIREKILKLFEKSGYSDKEAAETIGDDMGADITPLFIAALRRQMKLKQRGAVAAVPAPAAKKSAEPKKVARRRGRKPGSAATKLKPPVATTESDLVTLLDIENQASNLIEMISAYRRQSEQRRKQLVEALGV